MENQASHTTQSFHSQKMYYDTEKKMSLPDKRYLPRWAVHNRISYFTLEEGNTKECVSLDLSSVGICLQTKECLPVNQKVKMVIHLSEQASFEVLGNVRWSRQTAEGNQAGIIFEKITPHDQELILQHAFEVKHEDLVKHWFSGWEK